MKIAFLSHQDLNLYLFRLPIMKRLVEKGHEVYVIVPKGEVFGEFEKHGIKAISYEIKRESLNPFKELFSILEIKKKIKAINPDILHTFTHKPNIYGNLTGHKNIINTVTGLGSFFTKNDLKSKIVRAAIMLLYKTTAKNAKKVVFQNRDDMEYFLNKNVVSLSQAELIRSSGVDTSFFAPMPKSKRLLKELGLDEKPVVLMIARVLRDKGVEEYIKAAETLKDKAHFLYVGGIDYGNKNAYVPDWKNVKYLGFRKEIKELISISDVVVLPSYREGVPRTLLEAAAMAKPIVTTDTVGCREVVEDGKNGFLVPVKDHKILSQKIGLLLEDENLRKKMGEFGRIKAIEEFDVKKVVDAYLKLYEELNV